MEANNKLREALKTVKRYLDGYTVNILEMRRRVDAALAEPVKNCEVGTVQEQSKRFRNYCEAHKDRYAECLYCPLVGETGGHCELAWAQLACESDVKK